MRTLIGLVVLLLASFAFPVHAQCEGPGNQIDYQIPNDHRDGLSGTTLRFRQFCAAHTACYRTLGANREKCDEQYHAALSEYCADKYKRGSHAHGRCQRPVNESFTHLQKRGGRFFRADQRKLERAETAKKRRADRKRRRNQRQARRAERRRAAYRKVYEESLATKPNQ